MDTRELQRSPNPFVFIVGCLRSGTTLLRRMVDAHPALAVIHETQWLPRLFERRVGVTADGYVTPELIERLVAKPRFAELQIERGQLEQLLRNGDGGVPYARFVSAVFDLYGERQGKRLVGEKSPGYVRYVPTLHALWPDARIVHLVRDGRDVCLSVIDWKKAGHNAGRFSTWADDRVVTAALWWEWHVRQGREEGTRLAPGTYRELCYEELVADPESVCRALCEFLDLPYDEAMVQYDRHRDKGSWGRAAKGAWSPPTAGMRDWRTRMTRDDLERFEAAAGETLEAFGYERAVADLSPQVCEHVSRLRQIFEREARARRNVRVGDG